WTQANGMVGLGDLAGDRFESGAAGASGDGSIIAGTGASTASGANFEAFRCVPPGAPVGLGDLAPNPTFFSYSTGISADGLTIVGSGFSSAGFEAFRWTQASGLTGLGDIAGGRTESYANDVSSDGSVVVGDASTAASGTEYEAFRWTQPGG